MLVTPFCLEWKPRGYVYQPHRASVSNAGCSRPYLTQRRYAVDISLVNVIVFISLLPEATESLTVLRRPTSRHSSQGGALRNHPRRLRSIGVGCSPLLVDFTFRSQICECLIWIWLYINDFRASDDIGCRTKNMDFRPLVAHSCRLRARRARNCRRSRRYA